MKVTTVLKALNMMEKERVSEYLDSDLISLDGLVEILSDDNEREHVKFLYKLYELCDEIEDEESKTSRNVTEKGILKNVLKIDDETRKRFSELMKDYQPSVINPLFDINSPIYISKGINL